MALHPEFPRSPYAPLVPSQRWFPADETLRTTAYDKLLPPLVAKIREQVHAWRGKGYAGASATSVSLLRWWFETEHLLEDADGSRSAFRYYFAQREAVETLIWLYDVRRARDKFDLLRFDASGAVSSGMFDEDWPRYVLKMATGAGKTKVLWAVDFNYESRKEIIKVPKGAGINTVQGNLPGQEPAQRELELPAAEFEDRWTGAYIFENEWQSFRTRQKRSLEMTTASHTYAAPGRYTIAVKVIDIFGNDTMTLVRVTAG
jgi:hypothetical protein